MRAFMRMQALLEQNKSQIDRRMNYWVDNFGAQAAGWLMFKHRAQLHRYGCCDFKMPMTIETPAWIRVALETLRRRPNWSVQTFQLSNTKEKVFRVNWHGWGQGVQRVVIANDMG
jgi:hypothetical protein